MKSLGFRIAALLILAIVMVVGLATVAAMVAFRRPLPQTIVEPVARQIHVLANLAADERKAAQRAGLDIRSTPANGEVDARATGFLAQALEHTGPASKVIVSREPSGGGLTASVQLGGGDWLVTSVPDFSPPSGLPGFVMWILLIVAGSTVISIIAAVKITRPLRLIECAVGAVGPDGMLPPIPEMGASEVRVTARALNRLSKRLKSAMESRMRLVAAAGHDLRTPMTRMRLRVEFLPEEDRNRWLADLEELDRIADSAISLVREETLTDGDDLVRLGPLLRSIVDDAVQAGLSAQVGTMAQVTVTAGPVALRRALTNLVVNAATHGRGAFVSLECHGTQAVIRITDSGPGVPEDLIDQIFEPFFRVDIARRKTIPGAGLGMVIAREIIERFGGAIAVANRIPHGLLQTITFPLAETTGRQRSAEPAECSL
ncbi:signal transduction histidine kinase [Breoghania corrubedonensis]|uniref:histidine kinase n=1 Tax=Breoghania corrubedonensis TaxID=665038 RepID=A0A2T5UYH0_9HYPH|nr:ATP-binding protein [Breoghania corrubedonensis]PTW56549.1 signal transduction histidine kinase [Breoghania corrubedonensis]